MWQDLPPEQPGVGVALTMRLVKMAVRSMAYSYSVLTDDQKRVLSIYWSDIYWSWYARNDNEGRWWNGNERKLR